MNGQFVRFLFVGTFNTALGYAIIFFCMYAIELSAIISNLIGYGVGLISSYILNRFFTFRSKADSRSEVVRFIIVFLVSYLSNLAFLVLFINFLHVHEGVSQIFAGIVYVGVSYLLNKYYVFSNQSVEG